jgi:hypothetical protein
MRPRLCSFFLSAYCLFVPVTNFLSWAQLIEPTQTLNQGRELTAKLTVLSEPPGLQIMLDGTAIGTTPFFGIEVNAGTHLLEIETRKTSIKIEAGKNLQVALFKGSFIEVPQKKEGPSQSAAHIEEVPLAISKEKASGSDIPIVQDPFYWPLNPSGPIY